MDRRDFSRQLAVAAASLAALPLVPDALSAATPASPEASLVPQQGDAMASMQRFIDDLAQGDAKVREQIVPTKWRRIALVAYPGMFPLDLLGPKSIFEDLLNTHVHIVGKTKAPIATGRNAQLLPDVTFADCPENLDVIFVPGGGLGTMAMMRDQELHAFLRKQAETARFITSVCTGSLVLGSAGLLRGYKATTHWVTHDILAQLGATPVKSRVVEDRNRITGAGVTAGLDLAFVITSRLTGETYAKAEMLNVEYDPNPPFRAGTPKEAGKVVTGALSRMYEPLVGGMRAAATDASKRFG
ncbi:MAG: DJ-1/PfpI family protein [Gemmatimonadaceae bacterium]|jgi:cyclohexyl-isocyanide hydratase|nr:DJ-1/PfpI family protein [Gemmatimonadaceae bacterium]MCC7323554.1 DJ-1/PfpI family protein [Gemmatimonadaceae bacterium]HNV73145.1 DJ-1/PfpI family protein [Gemmatimonadaceae bacterium]